jgi:hypothetical protein
VTWAVSVGSDPRDGSQGASRARRTEWKACRRGVDLARQPASFTWRPVGQVRDLILESWLPVFTRGALGAVRGSSRCTRWSSVRLLQIGRPERLDEIQGRRRLTSGDGDAQPCHSGSLIFGERLTMPVGLDGGIRVRLVVVRPDDVDRFLTAFGRGFVL